jgi:hypothetical protein
MVAAVYGGARGRVMSGDGTGRDGRQARRAEHANASHDDGNSPVT